MLYLQKYTLEKMSIMTIKSFLGAKINDANASKPLIVSSRHNADELMQLTKKQVIEYAHKYNIAINSRKKKEELIAIIMRS